MTLKRINRGRGHSYTMDGEPVDGVTSLLKVIDKPALQNWAANATITYAIANWDELTKLPPYEKDKVLRGARFKDRDAAANQGTKVHNLAEHLVHGERVDVPDALAGHVESYVRFLNEWDPEPMLTETVVASRRHRYAGTLDLVAMVGGEVWLFDIKTSRSGIYPETALQLAAYRHADCWLDSDGTEAPMDAVNITRSAAIHVRSDGYDVIPLRSDERVYRDFLHVAWVARMTQRWDDWRGDPVSAPARAA